MPRKASNSNLKRVSVRSANSNRPMPAEKGARQSDFKGVSKLHGEDCEDCHDNVNIISGPVKKNVYDHKDVKLRRDDTMQKSNTSLSSAKKPPMNPAGFQTSFSSVGKQIMSGTNGSAGDSLNNSYVQQKSGGINALNNSQIRRRTYNNQSNQSPLGGALNMQINVNNTGPPKG